VLKRKYQLLLIVLIVLAAYSPAFFAGFSAVMTVPLRPIIGG